jgi:hypothetical protein
MQSVISQNVVMLNVVAPGEVMTKISFISCSHLKMKKRRKNKLFLFSHGANFIKLFGPNQC